MEKELVEEQFVDSPADTNYGDVMVVGGGISGIQAALDLAYCGLTRSTWSRRRRPLAARWPNSTRPFQPMTAPCALNLPNSLNVNRHPNIEILTYTEVDRVKGEAGDFKVTLNKKPRYIEEDKCTGCGACVEYCPVKVPDPYNQDLSLNKAIHIHFSQAVPLVTYIDPKACLFLQGEKCTICRGICKNKAIDLHQEEERREVEVGAIILAPGYEIFDPRAEGRLWLRKV